MELEEHKETNFSSNLSLSQHDILFKEKIDTLTKEHDDLNTIVIKFTKGKENLDVMLGQQRCAFNHEGLSYTSETKKPIN